jgi:hypothetical protein
MMINFQLFIELFEILEIKYQVQSTKYSCREKESGFQWGCWVNFNCILA